jgi:hypothetical protein
LEEKRLAAAVLGAEHVRAELAAMALVRRYDLLSLEDRSADQLVDVCQTRQLCIATDAGACRRDQGSTAEAEGPGPRAAHIIA